MELLLGVPGVPGSRMRHGGALEIPEMGLTFASDNWLRCRCIYCGDEAMTPAELIPEQAKRLPDGALEMHCPKCMADLASGHRPGHNPHRRRRRVRH
jgi:hypothetical protein